MERNSINCVFCDGKLVWDSDANLEDVCSEALEGDGGVVGFYTCSKCGRSYEISDPVKEERETIYKDYWDNEKR